MAKYYLLFLSLFLLAPLCLTFHANDLSEGVPILKDATGNFTDAELFSIKSFIATAEDQWGSTKNFEQIASYIANNSQGITPGVIYNVFVHEGILKQVGFNDTLAAQGKSLKLMNYGKYRFTYVMNGETTTSCPAYRLVIGGSSTAQFGTKFTENDQRLIFAVVNNGVLYRSNDIDANAFYIQQKLNIALGNSWAVVITDPNTKYGYCVCRSNGDKWFAFRGYQEFKWNYFGTAT